MTNSKVNMNTHIIDTPYCMGLIWKNAQLSESLSLVQIVLHIKLQSSKATTKSHSILKILAQNFISISGMDWTGVSLNFNFVCLWLYVMGHPNLHVHTLPSLIPSLPLLTHFPSLSNHIYNASKQHYFVLLENDAN